MLFRSRQSQADALSGCYCLDASEQGVRLGLAQLPSPRVLREIHDRLAGYPVFFQALSYSDAIKLRDLVAGDQQ